MKCRGLTPMVDVEEENLREGKRRICNHAIIDRLVIPSTDSELLFGSEGGIYCESPGDFHSSQTELHLENFEI